MSQKEKDLRKKNSLAKYGCEHPMQNESVKEKLRKIMMQNHGHEYTFQCDAFKQKSKATSLNNWGYEYPSQSPQFKQKVIETNQKNWGCDYPMQNSEFRKTITKSYEFDGNTFDSLPEMSFYIWLKDNNVQFQYQPNDIKIEYSDGIKIIYTIQILKLKIRLLK